MIGLSPAPSWLPSLLQPADWLVIRVLGVILLVAFVVGVGEFLKGGDQIG